MKKINDLNSFRKFLDEIEKKMKKTNGRVLSLSLEDRSAIYLSTMIIEDEFTIISENELFEIAFNKNFLIVVEDIENSLFKKIIIKDNLEEL